MTTTLAKTPLYDWHVAHGGRMVDFAGWSMPVQYSSIVAEHNATRNAVGLFDISHMGRLRFFGDCFVDFLDGVVTRRVTDMRPGQVRYSLVCNESGGILDDVLVYHGQLDHPRDFAMVVNASNRPKIFDWLNRQLAAWQTAHGKADSMSLGDDTEPTAMIAVQGPKAVELLARFVRLIESGPISDFSQMRYYHFAKAEFTDIETVTLSRTGYTGEDGFEIICERPNATEIWSRLISAANKLGGTAVGLGARDTLRLEAAMPLYGHELSEQINPVEADLGFAVNLKDRRFIGCEKLRELNRDQLPRVRIGLELSGKRPAREHYGIYGGGQLIGEVTSGTFSPTLQKPIAMGYVPPQFAKIGTAVELDIRGSREPAHVVEMPFYRRPK